MKKLWMAMSLVSSTLIGGCASDGRLDWAALQSNSASCAKVSADDRLQLDLAQNMANEGRLHAALANLEGLPQNIPEVRLRKARVSRLLGQPDATALYTSLLGTCLAAEGEHGLGQLDAANGQNVQAQAHLLKAVALAPTDDKVRNDLGVVYFNQLKLAEARFQFVTAMELQQDDRLAPQNLVALLIYQDNWQQASALVTRYNLTPQQVVEAQARATELKASGAKATAAVGTIAKPDMTPVTAPATASGAVAKMGNP